MKALFNVLGGGISREIVDTVRHLLNVDAAGRITYDRKAAKKLLYRYERPGEDGFNPLRNLYDAISAASALIADIAGVREAGGWKARAERLSQATALRDRFSDPSTLTD